MFIVIVLMRNKTSLNVSIAMSNLLSSCTQPSPPPPRATAGHFPALSVPGGIANFALPGGRAFTSPGAIPKLLTRMRLTTQRILLEKQAYWLICQGPEKIEEVCKGMFSILCVLFFSLHIKPESHGEIGSYQDVNQRFLDNLKLNQISVDII